MQKATLELIEAARVVLEDYNPMTVRQVYYQLVAAHIIPNEQREYKRLSRALVKGRQAGLIDWEWIEDRTRQPREVSMWSDLPNFIDAVRRSYRRDVWANQDMYVEVWLEKDALSGIFTRSVTEYGVTLAVGRGYNSWSALKDAAQRFKMQECRTMMVFGKILYFGDFDPSGEDIVRAIEEGLDFFGCEPEVEKVSLTREDIDEYDLPPDFTKASDSRQAAFVEKYGDIAVELDALPITVLQEKIRESIEDSIDMDALAEVKQQEADDQARLEELLE